MKENKPTQIVINGDNIELLKKYPNNYFDSVVTDCPYGLSKEPNAEEMLGAWIKTGYLEVKGSGFMGKEWDSFVPQPIFWKEIYRVLKYGGHIVAFFGTRTYDWGCMAIRLGGFEIRDCIQWVYGSGFPKSHNIGKAVDKIQGNEREEIGTSKANGIKAITKSRVEQGYRKNLTIANTRDERTLDKGNSDWEGWGSALKPANEPIVLARKPLEKGLSIAENMLKWGTGGINIDATRIGFKNNLDYKESTQKNQHEDFGTKPLTNNNVYGDYSMIQPKNYQPSGRFPSNFIMSHHKDCEDCNCVDDCPIKILDEQSGESKSSKRGSHNSRVRTLGDIYKQDRDEYRDDNTYGDKGGASRFFYVAKASQWERSFGLDEFEEKQVSDKKGNGLGRVCNICKTNILKPCYCKNNEWILPLNSKNSHPTIKPIELMQYLVRLVTQPNGIVLDAYAGSGTTGIACKIDGFNFIGLEISKEYTDIANQRIKSFNEENLLLKKTKIFKNKNKKNSNNHTELPFD